MSSEGIAYLTFGRNNEKILNKEKKIITPNNKMLIAIINAEPKFLSLKIKTSNFA